MVRITPPVNPPLCEGVISSVHGRWPPVKGANSLTIGKWPDSAHPPRGVSDLDG
jgi:hypothetical protein